MTWQSTLLSSACCISSPVNNDVFGQLCVWILNAKVPVLHLCSVQLADKTVNSIVVLLDKLDSVRLASIPKQAPFGRQSGQVGGRRGAKSKAVNRICQRISVLSRVVQADEDNLLPTKVFIFITHDDDDEECLL